MEITQAFYLIIEGDMNSKEYNSNLEYRFIRVPYNIEKELNTTREIYEKEQYISEIKYGKYRDQKLINDKYGL